MEVVSTGPNVSSPKLLLEASRLTLIIGEVVGLQNVG
jgi:hypothetical protein